MRAPGQSKPRLQTSSPSVSGAISPSIIDVHFRHGAVLNSHSTTVVELVGCASRSNRDKQADSAYEAVAIPTHTMSQQRLLEGLKSAAKVATIHRLERRGKPRGTVFLRRCMSTGIGTQYHQELVGLSGLDRLVIHDNFAQTITCSRTSARHTFVKSDGC